MRDYLIAGAIFAGFAALFYLPAFIAGWYLLPLSFSVAAVRMFAVATSVILSAGASYLLGTLVGQKNSALRNSAEKDILNKDLEEKYLEASECARSNRAELSRVKATIGDYVSAIDMYKAQSEHRFKLAEVERGINRDLSAELESSKAELAQVMQREDTGIASRDQQISKLTAENKKLNKLLEPMHRAATTIQRMVRGDLTRKRTRKEKAATKIQSIYRRAMRHSIIRLSMLLKKVPFLNMGTFGRGSARTILVDKSKRKNGPIRFVYRLEEFVGIYSGRTTNLERMFGEAWADLRAIFKNAAGARASEKLKNGIEKHAQNFFAISRRLILGMAANNMFKVADARMTPKQCLLIKQYVLDGKQPKELLQLTARSYFFDALSLSDPNVKLRGVTTSTPSEDPTDSGEPPEPAMLFNVITNEQGEEQVAIAAQERIRIEAARQQNLWMMQEAARVAQENARIAAEQQRLRALQQQRQQQYNLLPC